MSIATAALHNHSSMQGAGKHVSLRSLRTSEISSLVKNTNLARTHALKGALNIWHKEMSYRVRRMNQREEDMYRALLKLSLTKKKIKNCREGKTFDHHTQRKWARSKRRLRRNGEDVGSGALIRAHLESPLPDIQLDEPLLHPFEPSPPLPEHTRGAIETVQKANLTIEDGVGILPPIFPPLKYSGGSNYKQQTYNNSKTCEVDVGDFHSSKYRRMKKKAPSKPHEKIRETPLMTYDLLERPRHPGDLQGERRDPPEDREIMSSHDDLFVEDGGLIISNRKTRRKKNKCRDWNVSSIQVFPGKVYDVTVYKKDSHGNLQKDNLPFDTSVDIVKHFNLQSHRDRLNREKLLQKARDVEYRQKARVESFLSKLNEKEEMRENAARY